MEPGAAARDCGKRGFPEKRAFHFSRAGEFWRPPPGWEGQRLERGQSLSQPLEAPGSGESEQRLQPWLARDSLNTVEELRARLRRGRRLRGAGKRCGGPRLGEGWGGGAEDRRERQGLWNAGWNVKGEELLLWAWRAGGSRPRPPTGCPPPGRRVSPPSSADRLRALGRFSPLPSVALPREGLPESRSPA